MTLGPLFPLLSLFFVFLYKYAQLIDVSNKIQNLKEDDVGDIRDSNEEIFIHADDSCLYNHDNLCQKMQIID